jgi:glyoxylase-like metal-dependent hydrolase (beta-lactamase superfamily II)
MAQTATVPAMSLPRVDAASWYARKTIDDSITLIWEPHVVPLMRCNIWHVTGRDRDLVVDTGMGVVSLVGAAPDLFDGRAITAVATHGHDDHIGSHHEFDECLAHPLEAAFLEHPPLNSLSPEMAWGVEGLRALAASGYDMTDPFFVDALPPGVVVETFRQQPARVSRLVEDGDIVDLGDRQFEVLHLPGHSPGSIALWEAATGTLFSGDAIYDGPLLDELPESDIGAYLTTMERLLELPVTVVHAGHDPSFGRERLRELALAYLDRRRAA